MSGINGVEMVKPMEAQEMLQDMISKDFADKFRKFADSIDWVKKTSKDYPEWSFERYRQRLEDDKNTEIAETGKKKLQENITEDLETVDGGYFLADLIELEKRTGKSQNNSSVENLISEQSGANLDLLNA